MSLIHYENFDGVTAPSVPANWTVAAEWTTDTAAHGFTPPSSPNMLLYTPGGSAGTFFATYQTADGNSGNATVQATVGVDQVTGTQCRIGVMARCSSSTPSVGSVSMYSAWIDMNSQTVGLSKYVSGAKTDYSYGTSAVSPGYWYTLFFSLNGTAIQLQIQRLSDSYWFTGTSWSSFQGTAAAITDSSVTGSGYSGFYVVQSGSSGGFYGVADDFYFSTLSTSVPCPVPCVARVPHGWYPHYSE